MTYIFLIIGIIGILAGAALLLYSVFGRKSYYFMKKRCSANAEGTFVRFEEKEFSITRFERTYTEIYYYPVYEYSVNGGKYEVQSGEAKKTPDTALIDQKKQIRYNPFRCEESYVGGEDAGLTFKAVKILGIILIAAGIINVAIFILLKTLL